MLSKKIPFEIHITVNSLNAADQENFVLLCKALQSKPLLIELARGACSSQPMLSKTMASDNGEEVMAFADRLCNSLRQHAFTPKRVKIEIPAADAPVYTAIAGQPGLYFEWHGKIRYEDTAVLYRLCETHRVHLSRNALKDEPLYRFITLREYGPAFLFQDRIEKLLNTLAQQQRIVAKIQAEYCIYDNNILLDRGWLPENTTI